MLRLSTIVMACSAAFFSLSAQAVGVAGNPAQNGFDHMPAAAQGHARPPFHIKTAATTGPTGVSPSRINHFYGFDQLSNKGAGQTIAIISAYDDPKIESDLATFSQTYGLTSCTTTNGCFKKIYAKGSKPQTDGGWSLEMAMDVEWAHAIAPQAKIILVEAASSAFTDLIKAVDVAVSNGAKVVSMSFGGSEFSSQTLYDNHFASSGVTFVAAAGDSGSMAEYPASSSNVVAVGGTSISIDTTGNYIGERAWSGSGGGLSAYESEPSWQVSFGIPNNANAKRGVPDVAYSADPNNGFAVYSSVAYQGQSGWFQIGGTSAGAPQWSALFAIANSMRVAQGKTTLSGIGSSLYSAASGAYTWNFHDITLGSNGTCGANCTATSAYDYVTGLGSPVANNIVNTLVAQP